MVKHVIIWRLQRRRYVRTRQCEAASITPCNLEKGADMNVIDCTDERYISPKPGGPTV